MNIFKKLLPHLVAIGVFLLVSLAYFSPILDGKRLPQYDIKQHIGMSNEVDRFRAETGEEALWTNATFGGMPTYQISIHFKNNILQPINKFLTAGLPAPVYYIFLAMLGFYVMLLCFGVDPWLGIAGAIAFGLSTYFLIIIGAGHNTKMRALMFMPPIIGGIYYAFNRKKLWLGVLITCIALGLQIRSNHFQITYYTAIVVLIFLIFELVHIIKNTQYSRFIKVSAGLIVAMILAVSVNITNMLLTMEYTPYSTRGPSELTDNNGNNKTSGLDKDYILNNYSYSIVETMNLFIPNFVGGASVGDAGENSPYYKAMIENNVPKAQAQKISKQAYLYWGGQDGGTSGPVYIGAVIIFLFVLGLFVVKGRIKWWLVTATILSIMLAWGKHFLVLSDIFIDYFPLYNKFRTVSMILVIAELTIPLLGILALKEFFSKKFTSVDKQKALRNSFFIAGGISLFFVLLPGLFFSFTTPSDAILAEQTGLPDWLIATLPDTREAVMRGDAFRSFLFVAAAAVVLWLVVRNKLKVKPACILFAALILADMWTIDKRYLNNEKFVAAKEVKEPIKATAADKAILQDTDLDYRVLNLSVSTFNDATTSYFHKSVGGYHGAKMKRYQELIEHQITPEMSSIFAAFNTAKSTGDIMETFRKCNAINMLNTRYLIYSPEQEALINPEALGNAWPVSEIIWVENADAEMAALKDFDPAGALIVDKRYQPILENVTIKYDSTAMVELVTYAPNQLTYEYQSKEPQMVVFSEIFYDKGWNAYIDGELKPHVRANYILRAIPVPAGAHQIEFRFEPKSYARGEKISLASSILIVLMILGVIGSEIYAWKKSDN